MATTTWENRPPDKNGIQSRWVGIYEYRKDASVAGVSWRRVVRIEVQRSAGVSSGGAL